MTCQPIGGCRADHTEPDGSERAEILRRQQQPLDERVDGVAAREDDPVECACLRARLIERTVVVWRGDANHWRLHRFGAGGFKPFDELAGLLARAGDQHALPEERARVKPS